ncbi:hypothetical protein B0H66DRAFT_167527 [Apodospora peruviana]|uniref:Zn(2)-C6 fungal-type domain-containing protein n=1 Tax=Apodospora peruviana TaxID=516989 RepID=A0AAE0IKL5_9PEZI|nr:hypothetical protein B0H66DRAFT_167527 [Apodospora peruviana]
MGDTDLASDKQQVEAVMDNNNKQQALQSSDDGVDRHKQRASTACLPCRSRKRRCDGQKPTCSNCISVQSACHYPRVQKRRGPGKSKQRITVLENRLLILESQLRGGNSAVVQPEHSSRSGLADPQPLGSSGKAPESPMAPTRTGIRASQTAAELLPRHPLFRQVPDRIAEFKARLASDSAGSFRMMVASPVVPGYAELLLVEHSLQEICKEFPLFDTLEFLGRVRNQGAVTSIQACGGASRWACLNSAIALSVHVKTANGAFEELAPFAWAYFKNAYAVFPELMLQGNDSETVKALVFMALFARNSADARTTSLLLSTALRLSQTLDSSLFNVVESENARLTLWAAFILDAELSLCCGLASGPGAGDIDIDLPNEEYPHHGDDDEACASIFRRRAELALIHSAVRTRLYSRDAFNMPESELLSTIVTLNQALEDWRQTLPPEAQPGHVGAILEPHCIILHLAFHNLTSMVHWAAQRHSAWGDVATTRSGLEGQALSLINLSRLKVRAAAQHTLRLLRQSPFEQFAQFWRNLCYPLSAALTLLLYILECPQDPDAEADSQLLRGFGREVKRMQNDGDFELSHLLKAYLGLEHVGNVAISQAQSQNDERLEAARSAEPWQDHAFPQDDVQTFRELLSSATHPMYLVQGLLTNLPNRDHKISQSIARIIPGIMPLIDESKPYGPLVPACMKPGTYGFGFAARDST